MNTQNNNLEDKLTKLGQQIPFSQTTITNVMQQIDQSSKPRRRHPWLITTTITGIAASLTLAATLWLFLFAQPDTLYAQIVENLKNSQTAHVIGIYSHKDGTKERVEMWYDHNKGTVTIHESSKKSQIIEIDNGKSLLRHQTGDDFALVLPSRNPYEQIMKFMAFSKFQSETKPIPSKDTWINNNLCKAYLLSERDVLIKNKLALIIWVDSQSRIRRMEAEYSEEQASLVDSTKAILDITYNIEIPPSRFNSNFGPDIRTIDPTQFFSKKFDLKKALYTQKTLDMIFAIHEVKSGENGMSYIVSSLRPTKEALAEKKPNRSFGNIILIPRYPDANQIELASQTNSDNSLLIKWWINIPKKQSAIQPSKINSHNKVQLDVHVFSKNPRYKNIDEGVVKTDKIIKAVVNLPQTDKQLSLKNICDHVYDELSQLERIVPRSNLNVFFAKQKGRRFFFTSKSPSQTSQDEFYKETKNVLTCYKIKFNQ